MDQELTQEQESKKPTLQVSLENLQGLIDLKIEPSHLYILKLIEQNPKVYLSDLKSLGWKQFLLRKKYINEDGTLTEAGKFLANGNISGVVKVKKEAVKTKSSEKVQSDFDKWWEIFPDSDGFTHKGVTFAITSGKKNLKKELCQTIFEKYVKEEKYTAEQIVSATAAYILSKKEESCRKKANQMTYVPNSERFLREAHFSPFIGKVVKEEVKISNDTFL